MRSAHTSNWKPSKSVVRKRVAAIGVGIVFILLGIAVLSLAGGHAVAKTE